MRVLQRVSDMPAGLVQSLAGMRWSELHMCRELWIFDTSEVPCIDTFICILNVVPACKVYARLTESQQTGFWGTWWPVLRLANIQRPASSTDKAKRVSLRHPKRSPPRIKLPSVTGCKIILQDHHRRFWHWIILISWQDGSERSRPSRTICLSLSFGICLGCRRSRELCSPLDGQLFRIRRLGI